MKCLVPLPWKVAMTTQSSLAFVLLTVIQCRHNCGANAAFVITQSNIRHHPQNHGSGMTPSSFGSPRSGGLLFVGTSVAQRRQSSPRISQADFRLDYMTGMTKSFNGTTAATATTASNGAGANKEDVVGFPTDRMTEDFMLVPIPPSKVTERNFVYGDGSACYRGLTGPSKAGLVLAILLSSGMVVASPEIDWPTTLSSLTSGNDGFTAGLIDLSSLAMVLGRPAFQWDVSGVVESFQQVSDGLVTSYNTEWLPFLSQQQSQWQDGWMTLSGQVQDWTLQMTSNVNRMMEDDVIPKWTALQDTASQIVSQGQTVALDKTVEWQSISENKINEWQQEFAHVSNQVQEEANQLWSAGMTQFQREYGTASSQLNAQMEELSARAGQQTTVWQSMGQAKADQWQRDAVQMGGQLQGEATLLWTHGKDVLAEKSAEWQQIGLLKMEQWQDDLTNAAGQLQAQEQEFSARAGQKSAEWQVIGQDKMGQWQQSFLKTASQWQADAAKLWTEVKAIVDETFVEYRQQGEVKLGQLQTELAQLNGQRQAQMEGLSNRVKDTAMQTSADLHQSSQGKIDELGQYMTRLSTDIQNQVDQVSTEGKDLAMEKYTLLQQSSQSKLDMAKQEYLQAASRIQGTTNNLLNELGLKTTDVGDDVFPRLKDSGRSLVDKTESLRDATVANANRLQGELASQGTKAIDDVGSAFQGWNEGMSSQLSKLESAATTKAAEAKSGAMSTPSVVGDESAYLKTVLKSLVERDV